MLFVSMIHSLTNENLNNLFLIKHKTQGFIVDQFPYFNNRVIIKAIQPGTAPRNAKRWIHRLKHCHLLCNNNVNVILYILIMTYQCYTLINCQP